MGLRIDFLSIPQTHLYVSQFMIFAPEDSASAAVL